MINLTLMTFNIGSLYSEAPKEREAELLSLISRLSPDIMCLEELPELPELMDGIASAGGFTGRIYLPCSESHVCRGHRMGIGVYGKLPLKLLDTIALPRPAEYGFSSGRREPIHQKYFCSLLVSAPRGAVNIVTGHGYPAHRYSFTREVYAPSFSVLDGFIAEAEHAGTPTVVLADFNIPDPLDCMPRAKATHRDIFDGESTRPSGRKTDGILVPTGTKTITKHNIPTGFDHNCLCATLELPAR